MYVLYIALHQRKSFNDATFIAIKHTRCIYIYLSVHAPNIRYNYQCKKKQRHNDSVRMSTLFLRSHSSHIVSNESYFFFIYYFVLCISLSWHICQAFYSCAKFIRVIGELDFWHLHKIIRWICFQSFQCHRRHSHLFSFSRALLSSNAFFFEPLFLFRIIKVREKKKRK